MWKLADEDKDGFLTISELSAFLNPKYYDSTKEAYLKHTLESIDPDGDGKINLQEYLGSISIRLITYRI